MKKLLSGAILLTASSSAFADTPGGVDCGWGNLLFEGDSGLGIHVLAATTNGTSGNNTFGMSSGTNGCTVNGKLTYGGKSLFASIMDRFSEDVAQGGGEALDAVATIYGIAPEDRDTFAKLTHDNFKQIFPNADVTVEQTISSLEVVMKTDERLAKYVI